MVPRALQVLLLLVAPAVCAQTVHFSLVDGTRLGAEVAASSRRAISQAIRASTKAPVDISPVAAALFLPGMLLSDFKREPPTGWPDALAGAWREGHRTCAALQAAKKKGEEPPDPRARMAAATAAAECRRVLTRALYGRYLDHLGATAVLEVSVAEAQGGADSAAQVSAVHFHPSVPKSARRLTRVAPRAKIVDAVEAITAEALSGAGEATVYSLDRTLPKKPRSTDPVPAR